MRYDNAIIYALATGAIRGAIAIIRVSGAGAAGVLRSLCRKECPAPRRACLRGLYDAHDKLDDALVLWFPGPQSYTGEDSFELHVHAGLAVIESVSLALNALGARPAEAGEFTRRAVQNGRLDLLQAEAISDLIAAETAQQRRQALRQADGALGALYGLWASQLKRILARHEAQIDFPDDMSGADGADWRDEVATLRFEMEAHLARREGEAIRGGYHVVIAGDPNVGKSSLLNRLAGYDAAIVTARAGTTRDPIVVDWVYKGYKLRLIDTAGLRETDDEIEFEGIRRAMFHVEQADLIIQLFHGSRPTPLRDDALLIRSKIDVSPAPSGVCGVSALTGAGIEALLQELEDRLKLNNVTNSAPLTRARHRASVQEALLYVNEACAAEWPELEAEALRLALRALGRLTGEVDVEEILDVIFSQFCIGK